MPTANMYSIKITTLAVMLCVAWWPSKGTDFALADSIHSETDFINWISSSNQSATLYGNIILTKALPLINRPVNLLGGTSFHPGSSGADSISMASVTCAAPTFTALTILPSSMRITSPIPTEYTITNLTWSGCGTALSFLQSTDASQLAFNVSLKVTGCVFQRNGNMSSVGD